MQSNSSRTWSPVDLLAIIAAVLAARMPLMALPRLYDDELIYAVFGHFWVAGDAPYTLLWDVKPPGLFALYALSELVTGDPLIGPRLLPLLAVLASAIGLWRIGLIWFGDRTVGVCAGVLYAAYTLVLSGTFGTSELLFAPFVIFGLLLASTPRAGAVAVAGLLFGYAVMIKQVAAFEGLLGLIVVATTNRGAGRALWGRLALFVACGAAPTFGFGAYYAAQGRFENFWDAAVVAALLRTRGDGLSFAEGLSRVVPTLKPVAPLLLLSMLAVAERRWFRGRPFAPFARTLAWFGLALLGAIAVRAQYDRYFLTTVPALSLGAALYLAELKRRWASLRFAPALPAALVALGLLPFAWVTYNDEWPTGSRHTPEIAEHLRRLGLVAGLDNELYVADHELVVYLLAGAVPPTKFAIAQHLGCEFALPAGVDAEKEIDRILGRLPRFVVMSEQRTRFYCTRPDRMARIGGHLERNYDLVEKFGDSWDPVIIYQRKASAAASAQSPGAAQRN